MTVPLVSVIVPSYNAAGFIGRTIDSVCQQTVSAWEILVVDNHSADGTADVVHGYGDERISLHRIHNQGVIAASRNVGVRAARGRWLAFLDADDWWAPTKLERCLAAAEGGADIVYHPLMTMKDADGTELVPGSVMASRQVRTPVFLDLIRRNNAIWTSSVLASAELVRGLDGFSENPAMAGIEDYNLWLRASLVTERFTYVDEVLGYYLAHGANTSAGDMSGPFEAAVTPFFSRLDRDDQRRLREIVEYLRARHSFGRGEYSRIRGDLLRLALRAKPAVRFKAIARLLMTLRPDAPVSP